MSKSREAKSFRTFQFKVESASENSDTGMIKGYASTFGNVDQGWDIVDPGAFTKSIQESKGRWPILLDHDSTKQVGWNIEASEDNYGLRVNGEMQLITDEARNRYKLAKRAMELGTKMGLSIGYTTIKSEPDYDRPMVRHLKEVRLWEYSIVTFPMNEQASVDGVKKLFDGLKNRGYTQSQIEEALKKLGMQPGRSSEPPESMQADPELLQSVDRLLKLFS